MNATRYKTNVCTHLKVNTDVNVAQQGQCTSLEVASALNLQRPYQLPNNFSFCLLALSAIVVEQLHFLRSQLNLQTLASNWSWGWHKSLVIGSTLVDHCATIVSSTAYTHHHTMSQNRAIAGGIFNAY